MRLQSQADIGAACVSAFVVGSAFRDVYLGDIFRSVNIFLVLLIAFGIAAIAGLAIALAKGESLKTVLRSPRDTILMNLATAGAWICYFLALKWLEPSIVNTLFAGVGPFVVIALNGCGLAIAAPHPTTPLQRTLQLGIVVSLAALVWIVAAGRSGLAGIQSRDALAGAGLALLSGALITVGHLYAKRLNEAGASPHAIMGTRFIALLFVAVTAIAQAGPAAVLVPVPELARIAVAATLLIVVPVFLNQIGMAMISPLGARIITAAGPVLVFALQQFDPRIQWSTGTLAAILAYSGFVLAANAVHGRVWKMRKPIPC